MSDIDSEISSIYSEEHIDNTKDTIDNIEDISANNVELSEIIEYKKYINRNNDIFIFHYLEEDYNDYESDDYNKYEDNLEKNVLFHYANDYKKFLLKKEEENVGESLNQSNNNNLEILKILKNIELKLNKLELSYQKNNILELILEFMCFIIILISIFYLIYTKNQNYN